MNNNNNKRVHVMTCVLASSRLYFETLINYADIDSSSEDENAKETVLIELISSRLNPRKRKIPRCQDYFELIIPNYLPGEFQANFRLTPAAFETLCEQLIPLLLQEYKTGRPLHKPEKQLLAVLWLLATPDSYRSIGSQFDIGKGHLNDAFVRIIKALNKLAPRVIKWPSLEDRQRIMESFYSYARMNNVVGAVDGTYVPIKAPREDPEVYVTRKCFHAITLQAIAVPTLNFTDCFAGYPGSVNDNRIFRNSPIYDQIQRHTAEFFTPNTFIIGDKAYPLLSWCIPPYIERRRLTHLQSNFNRVHAKTRQVVERSFALLFGRFRRLKYLDMQRLDLIPSTIIACCVLHNICLQHQDLFVENYIQEGLEFVQNENVEQGDFQDNPIEAQNQRDNIARELFEHQRNRPLDD